MKDNNDFESENRSSIEIRVTAAISLRNFDSIPEIISPLITELISEMPKELLAVLMKLSDEWSTQFISTQLLAAFLRGWRINSTGNKLESAEDEVKTEVNFLVSHNSTDVALTCSNRINDYFCDAVWLYAKTDDPSARLAALSAAVVAQDEQRQSLIDYLQALSIDWLNRAPNLTSVHSRLDELATDISSQDWTLYDTVNLKAQLHKIDPEYCLALNGSDPTVFRHRFPDIFRDYDVLYPQPE